MSSSAPHDEEVQPEKKLKFSAFARKERDFSVPDQVQRKKIYHPEMLKIKEEFNRVPFDENVRHRIDDMENSIIWRGLEGF